VGYATGDTITLLWNDNSLDEVGFEVWRRGGSGASVFQVARPVNAISHVDGGLSPDTTFVYSVRSVNSIRGSAFVEIEGMTSPTLAVTAVKGDLVDSAKFGKDAMKVTATFEFLAGESDGAADFVAEGITLRVGTDAAPVVLSLPKNLDGWKVKGSKASWKSPKGSTTKYAVQVDLARRLVTASAAGLEFANPPANPMRVSIGVGNDGGTARGDWVEKKPGVFQLR